MTRTNIAAAYAGPVFLAMAVAVFSSVSGDAATVTFHKVLLAPLFLLATRGLRSYFPEHLDRQRRLAGFAEYHLLDSALLAAFLTIVTGWGHTDLMRQVMTFMVVTLLIAAVNLLMLLYGRRRSRGKR